MNNIVFFGQADAGKSTLAGYLVSKYCPEFDFIRFIDNMKRSQPNYDIRLAFSSIINTNRDEVDNANKLNSTSIHLRRIPDKDITIIDTPGSERFHKQRERGMYYGSIGIFFMEINNILEHKYDTETIAPIALWSKMENERMIFLLTKFDMVEYSQELYQKAYDKVQQICSDLGFAGKVTVIPTAIEVDQIKYYYENGKLDNIDLGENIRTRSKKMPWFNGDSVIEAIQTEVKDLIQRDEEEPLIFCITDQIDNPESGYSGKAWNIKVLSGILRSGQEVCLAPIKDTAGNYCVLKANIKLLRSDLSRFDEKRAPLSFAKKGDICGMDIRNCSIDKRHASKAEYDAISSTCGFSSNSEYLMSDEFVFKINDSDKDGFKKDRQMKLVWFGRSLSFSITNIEEDGLIIHGRLINSQIALPIYSTTFSQSILIKGNGPLDFYNCKFLCIGEKS